MSSTMTTCICCTLLVRVLIAHASRLRIGDDIVNSKTELLTTSAQTCNSGTTTAQTCNSGVLSLLAQWHSPASVCHKSPDISALRHCWRYDAT